MNPRFFRFLILPLLICSALLAAEPNYPTASTEALTKIKPSGATQNDLVNGTFNVPSGATATWKAGSTATFNGTLSGTPTGGTLNLSGLTLTLGAQSGSGLTNLNASNLSSGTVAAARLPALTGDITTSAGSAATTLATVNSNVGTYGSATAAPAVTVNGKGLVTAASNITITPAVGSITGLGSGVATALAAAPNATGGVVTFGGNIGAATGTSLSTTGNVSAGGSLNTTFDVNSGRGVYVTAGGSLAATASRGMLDYSSGLRLYAWGADSSTRGTMAFRAATSTGSNDIVWLSSDASGNGSFYGNVTASGSVTAGSFVQAGSTNYPYLKFYSTDASAQIAEIGSVKTGTNGGTLAFSTKPDGGALTSGLTIGSTGNLTASGAGTHQIGGQSAKIAVGTNSAGTETLTVAGAVEAFGRLAGTTDSGWGTLQGKPAYGVLTSRSGGFGSTFNAALTGYGVVFDSGYESPFIYGYESTGNAFVVGSVGVADRNPATGLTPRFTVALDTGAANFAGPVTTNGVLNTSPGTFNFVTTRNDAGLGTDVGIISAKSAAEHSRLSFQRGTGSDTGQVTISTVATNGGALTERFKIAQDGAATFTSTVTVGGGATVQKFLTATSTLNFGSIAAHGEEELTITVTGAAVGDVVSLGLPASIESDLTFHARVSASNTVTVRAHNSNQTGGAAIDPASASYRVMVTKF